MFKKDEKEIKIVFVFERKKKHYDSIIFKFNDIMKQYKEQNTYANPLN